MEALHFSISVAAPRSVVWRVLLDDELFRKWTSVFAEGSHYGGGGWNEGDSIRFLTPGGDGMIGEIAANQELAFLSIRHLGQIVGGVVDPESDEVKAWAPAYENYTLEEGGGTATLSVDMDVPADYREYFQAMWLQALQEVRAFVERLAQK